MKTLALALTVLLTSQAHAILNIESLRLKMRNEPAGALLSVSYDRKEGNTDTNRFKGAGQGITRAGEFEHLATLEREFGTTAGVHDTDRALVHARTNWLYKNPLSYEAYAQLEEDQFRRLSMRGLVGAGLRQRIADETEFMLFTGVGAFWSRETLEHAPETTDAGTTDISRANVYFSFNYLIVPEIELNGIVYYQPAVRSIADYRVLNTTQTVMRVNERLSVSFNYTLAYDSLPPEKVQRADQSYSTALNFRF